MTRRTLLLFGIFLLAILLACKKRPTPAPAPGPKTTGTPLPPPALEQAPIRVNETVSTPKSGASVRVRMFVSTITSQDPIHFGFQLAPEKPIEQGHPWLSEQVDWSEALAALVFEIK